MPHRRTLTALAVIAIAVTGLFILAEFPQSVQRSILMGQFITCALLSSFLVGHLWKSRGAAIRTTVIGAAGIFVYLVAGQAKALSIGIPFDAFSWVGVVASGLFIIGAFWTLRTDHRWG